MTFGESVRRPWPLRFLPSEPGSKTHESLRRRYWLDSPAQVPAVRSEVHEHIARRCGTRCADAARSAVGELLARAVTVSDQALEVDVEEEPDSVMLTVALRPREGASLKCLELDESTFGGLMVSDVVSDSGTAHQRETVSAWCRVDRES